VVDRHNFLQCSRHSPNATVSLPMHLFMTELFETSFFEKSSFVFNPQTYSDTLVLQHNFHAKDLSLSVL